MGENHSLALTRAGELYSWGHGDRGRLGVETSTRVGVPDAERGYFPTPMLLHTFANEVVRQVTYVLTEPHMGIFVTCLCAMLGGLVFLYTYIWAGKFERDDSHWCVLMAPLGLTVVESQGCKV